MFTFSELIAPLPIEHFFEEYWFKQPLYLARHSSTIYSSIFTLEQLKRLLVELPLTVSDPLKLIKEGYSLPLSFLVRHNQLIDQGELWKYYFQGYTIVFDKIIDYFPQLMSPCHDLYQLFCQESQESFSHIDINAYLTPKGNQQGLLPHFDNHPVFVLQIEGQKQWRIYEHRETFEAVSKGKDGGDLRKLLNPPTLEIEMSPGDLLYLPEGYFHEAYSEANDFSFHLSIALMISDEREQWGFQRLNQIYHSFQVTPYLSK